MRLPGHVDVYPHHAAAHPKIAQQTLRSPACNETGRPMLAKTCRTNFNQLVRPHRLHRSAHNDVREKSARSGESVKSHETFK
jgi:hypothetical protein